MFNLRNPWKVTDNTEGLKCFLFVCIPCFYKLSYFLFFHFLSFLVCRNTCLKGTKTSLSHLSSYSCPNPSDLPQIDLSALIKILSLTFILTRTHISHTDMDSAIISFGKLCRSRCSVPKCSAVSAAIQPLVTNWASLQCS